jgi:hypothetical protein
MIEFVGNIEDFWSQHLSNFVFPHRVKVAGQRDYFHPNYVDAEILQAFGDEIPKHNKFFEALKIKQGSISLTCLQPGQIIPVHTDSFYKLRQDYNVKLEQCIRFLIFLNDWELGHIAEFQETCITKWCKGDVWKFDYNSKHCAANASQATFITCQVNTF